MTTQTPTILLLGTCDTKLSELVYTKTQIEKLNAKALLLDIGRNTTHHPEIDISQDDVLNAEPYNLTPTTSPNKNINDDDTTKDISTKPPIPSLPRNEYITTLTPYLHTTIHSLHTNKTIHGILALGGSCGTALSATVMRQALPIGFPKLLVSTMASGDVGTYIGESDISIMYSVVDIAGRNGLLERVLGNAAGSVVGMAGVYLSDRNQGVQVGEGSDAEKGKEGGKGGIRIGISMFGVTTPAVTFARQHLESILPDCEIYIFHATGSGGKAMERLIAEEHLDAVLDLTTTEIADEVVGGVLSAGSERLCAATRRDIPRVVSVGACDMVNFGAWGSVPPKFLDGGGEGEGARVFYEHNPSVTLMRTTRQENGEIGRLMARNLLGCEGQRDAGGESVVRRTRVLLPTGGISMLDVPGQKFWDAEADEVLFSTLEKELEGSGIAVTRDPRQINDRGFAVAAAEMLRELIEQS